MNKIKHWIGWLMIRLDYWIFHCNIPWDIYVESEIIAIFERDLRLAKREEKIYDEVNKSVKQLRKRKRNQKYE